MLSDLELSKSEVIIFENLENTAERLNDLEDSDKDNWATVAYTEKNLAQMLPLAVELLRLAEESCATMHLGMLRSLCR